MKPHRVHFLAFAALAGALPLSSAHAALTLVNGDFQNTTGLTDIGGGWYSGSPAGWVGRAVNYAVGNVGGNVVANLDQAAATSPSFQPLYQDLGILDQNSTITITFTLLQPWGGGTVSTGVALWSDPAFQNALATTSFLPVGTYTLTATNVPAGTEVRLGFWKSNSLAQYPGLDNVTMSVTPVPESSSAAIAGLGALMLASRRNRRKGGAGC